MKDNKKQDYSSEEDYLLEEDYSPEENYFSETEVEKEAFKDKVPPPNNSFPKAGINRLFSIVTWLFLLGFAAPLLSVFLIKSPQPDQPLIFLGISYSKLVFIFFLSAAIMVHVSLFFLRVRPVMIFLVFILSLFCCFPFIVGLRNNLPLQQVILDIPLFSNWPFFLKPAYLMIEFLIPIGLIIYLFLQIRSLFSRKPRGYAFLGAAIYLAIAAFLGFSTLIQAKQPNIATALVRQMGTNPQPDQEKGFPIPDTPNKDQGEVDKASPPDYKELTGVEENIQLLSGKVDRLIVELEKMKDFFTAQQENQKELSTMGRENVVKEPSDDRKTVDGLRKEVRLLSDKVDLISNALSKMASLLPEQPGKQQKDETGDQQKDNDKPKEGHYSIGNGISRLPTP